MSIEDSGLQTAKYIPEVMESHLRYLSAWRTRAVRQWIYCPKTT